MKFRIVFFLVLLLPSGLAVGQSLKEVALEGLQTNAFKDASGKLWNYHSPLVEFSVNGKSYLTNEKSPLEITVSILAIDLGVKLRITFANSTQDTLSLSNVVPFGRSSKDIYITGRGDHPLSRAYLFLAGKTSVNVILPDNVWHLGYCSFKMDNDHSVFGLTRRDPDSFLKAIRKRFETILAPGGSVSYFLYCDLFTGSWQEGIREAFQHRYLYDLNQFNDALYKREDLQWIKGAYVMHLMMAWDNDYFDISTGTFNWNRFEAHGKKLYGGDDVICLWPTWPALGLDQRNQFDLYRDLPGGLSTLRTLGDSLRSKGTRFFVAYNPWDKSTRSEGHLQGLAELIQSTSADGVVLDTKGESSKELQEAADQVKPGVIMYSEGMAVPKDMQGIVSGRVHNALYYPPVLNLNKLIRPDFAIFRVAEVFKERIQREYALAFFNGYGTEINQFAPGHPEWEEDQYRYLGKTTRILRENHSNFTAFNWSPLISTSRDSVWVNEWPHGNKTIYTIFSIIPQGSNNALLKIRYEVGFHFVDLWHHKEVIAVQKDNDWYVRAETNSFNASDLGTNNEGGVDCIARLPQVLRCKVLGNNLHIESIGGDEVRVWTGDPSYEKEHATLRPGNQDVVLSDHFGRYEGKLVVQVFEKGELLDESNVEVRPGTPRLVSKQNFKASPSPAGKVMVKIPAGKFIFHETHGDDFIPYPEEMEGSAVVTTGFFMDKHPVTNAQFREFLNSSHYEPADTSNFLKHWHQGSIPKGEENFPVVYVSYEDAHAFAKWAGKRLPTEVEWQYAAQTEKQNEWPWPQLKPVERKEQVVTETLTVTSLEGIDPVRCNLGDGKLYAVGKYPKGANPSGLQDLVGCVWQLTNDVYESGSYRYIMMKGGSYFKPSSSWWYVQGGPRELHYRQFLLRVSPGFERTATVGFRCVRD